MTAPQPDLDRPSRLRRTVGMVSWVTGFVLAVALIGLPTDPAYAFGWLWLATIAWNSHRPWRSHLAFLRDWFPVVLFLALYNVSRGLAGAGMPHVHELVHADVWLFGWATGGLTPTVWLQRELYDPDALRWWDVVGSWVYFSHFVAAITVAVVLWLRNRSLSGAFVRRWALLSFAGLITYFVYPAAPPWWAAEHGIVDSVARISTRGWHAIGMHGAGNLLNAAQLDVSNPVAAMPSLHSAFALLVVVFFFPIIRKRWIPVLLLYPLAMTFTLVYSGEHWVIDVLVGWLYVGAVFLICARGERWWADRKVRKAEEPQPEPIAIQ